MYSVQERQPKLELEATLLNISGSNNLTAIVNNMLGRAADEDFVDEHAEELTQFSDIEKHWAYYHIIEATNDHDYTKPSSGENWTKLN